MDDRRGVIYKIICNATGMAYVGQAKLLKFKNEKPYNYGSRGRWNDHKYSAKKTTTPLAKAIREHGHDAFEIVDLETNVEEANLDAREAYWIEHENTLDPNGYNVMTHSRNKHNRTTNFHTMFDPDTIQRLEIHPINKEGVPTMLYVYVRFKDETSKRITFGQEKPPNMQKAIAEAYEFCEQFDCEVKDYLDAAKPAPQARAFSGRITEVTITTASKLIAVYVRTDEMTEQIQRHRACFGGKTMTREEAYANAMKYVETLALDATTRIDDKVKKLPISSQQAAAV